MRRAVAISLLAAAVAQDVESTLTTRLVTTLDQFPCTRLLSSTTDIGCSTGEDGVTGFLFAIDSGADAAAFSNLPLNSAPRVVILPPGQMFLQTLQTLSDLPFFAGVVAAPSPLVPADGYSPESRELPKGTSPGYTWNPYGRNLIFSRFRFPLITVDAAEAARLRALAASNAQGGYSSFPQYAVHLFYYMGPDNLDSHQCLDAGSCLPLGGQSVWGSIGPIDSAPPVMLQLVPASSGARLLEDGAAAPSLLGPARGAELASAAAAAAEGGRHRVVVLPHDRATGAGVEQAKRKQQHRQQQGQKKAPLLQVEGAASQDAGRRLTADAAPGTPGFGARAMPAPGASTEAVEGLTQGARSVQAISGSGAGVRAVQRPIIMAVTAVDSSALFHDLAFGADSGVSGIVALLAAADALSRTDVATLPHQVLFGLFQAEQWGRIGSRRWVEEVHSFSCAGNVTAAVSPSGRAYCSNPLRTDLSFASLQLMDISYVLAVDQVGRPGLNALYLHEYDRSLPVPTNKTFAVLDALAPSLPVPVVKAGDTPVPPPTPLLSFQESIDGAPPLAFDGAVLSGYNLAFASPFFHSEFDNASNIDPQSVTAAATALARGLYALASNGTTPAAAAAAVPAGLAADASLVAQMVSCITVNAQCPLFARVLGVSNATLAQLVPAGPLSLYTGVYNQPYTLPNNGYVLQPTPLEAFIRNSLGYSTAVLRNGTCSATAECQARVGKAYECLLGTCVVANAFYHDALSPALASTQSFGVYTIDNAKVSESDPLWTEPYWSVRIGATSFKKDSTATEGAVLGVGLAVFLLSVVGSRYLVRFLDAHYKIP